MSRPLSEIAADIATDMALTLGPASNARVWTAPYLEAMRTLSGIDDQYMAENGRDIVGYFLANAASWRGGNARRIKAELRAMLARR